MTLLQTQTTKTTPIDFVEIIEGYMFTHLSPSNQWVMDTDLDGVLIENYLKWTTRTEQDPNNVGLLFSFLNTNFRVYLKQVTTKEQVQTDLKEPGHLGTSDYTRQSTRNPLSTLVSEETCEELMGPLSDRQRDVLLLLVDGYNQTEISEVEGVSKMMISKIIRQIRTKLINNFQ